MPGVHHRKVNLRDFMQVKNTLNLQIFDLMKEEGCEFAFRRRRWFAGEEVRLGSNDSKGFPHRGKLSPQATDEG